MSKEKEVTKKFWSIYLMAMIIVLILIIGTSIIDRINQSMTLQNGVEKSNTPIIITKITIKTKLVTPSVTSTIAANNTATHTTGPTLPPTLAPLDKAIVQVSSVNLRSGPSIKYSVIGNAKKGEELPVFGRSKDGAWLQISREIQIWISSSVVNVKNDINSLPIAPSVTPTIKATSTVTQTVKPKVKPGDAAYYGCKTNWMIEGISDMKMCVKSVSVVQSTGGYRASAGNVIVSIRVFVIGDQLYDEKIAADYFRAYPYKSDLSYRGTKINNCKVPMSWPYDCLVERFSKEDFTVLIIIPSELVHNGLNLSFADSTKVALPLK